MYYVYILESLNFGKYYVGQTANIETRLKSHNNGQTKSTSRYKPWKIICIIEKPTRSEAMRLEKKIKNLNRERLREFVKKYSI